LRQGDRRDDRMPGARLAGEADGARLEIDFLDGRAEQDLTAAQARDEGARQGFDAAFFRIKKGDVVAHLGRDIADGTFDDVFELGDGHEARAPLAGYFARMNSP